MLLDLLRMKKSGFSGMSFGVMEGVVSVLSVLVGLGSVADKSAVFIAMIIVGVADAMANAAGIRVSQETVIQNTKKQIFMSMLLAFLATFFVTVTLVAPLILFSLSSAILISTVIGFIFLSGLGVFISIRRNYGRKEMFVLIAEYAITGAIIIFISYVLGVFYNAP